MVHHHPGDPYRRMLPSTRVRCAQQVFVVCPLGARLCRVSVNKTDEDPRPHGGHLPVAPGGRRQTINYRHDKQVVVQYIRG